MIKLVKTNGNLVIKTDKESLIGTEIYVNDGLKFTITEEGMESESLGPEFTALKFGGRLCMVNLNKLKEHYGSFFEAGINEDLVKWYIDGQFYHTGYYVTKEDGEPIGSGNLTCYAKLVLNKTDNEFYVYCYITDLGPAAA